MRGRQTAILALLVGLVLSFGTPRSFAQGVTSDNPLDIYTWRYEKRVTNNHETVKRIKMTWQEGEAWDKERLEQFRQQATQGQLPGQPGGADPDALATWKLYYDQVVLWEEYLKQTALEGVQVPVGVEDIQWVTPSAEPGGQPQRTGAEAVVAANQSKSLDQQTGDFFTLGGGGNAAQGQAVGPVTRDRILEQVINLYGIFKSQGQEVDAQTYKTAQDITGGLSDREGRRLAYRNWLDDRKDMVIETAQDWGKRQQGQVIVVDDIQYELYSPAQGLPKGPGPSNVVRVVTDNLTPYDLLNADGSQKSPSGP